MFLSREYVQYRIKELSRQLTPEMADTILAYGEPAMIATVVGTIPYAMPERRRAGVRRDIIVGYMDKIFSKASYEYTDAERKHMICSVQKCAHKVR